MMAFSNEELVTKFENSPPERVLFVMHGAVGDITRALPLASRLKKNWPHTKLIWGVEPKCQSLVRRHLAIDEVVVFDRSGGFRSFLTYVKEIQNLKASITFDLQRHLKSGLVTFFSRAPVRVAFNRKNSREGNWLFSNYHIMPQEHLSSKALQFQKFGDLFGWAEEETYDMGISVSEQRARDIVNRLGLEVIDYAAFLVGSVWPSKFWEADHYAKLAQMIYRDRGLKSLLIGSNQEIGFAETIAQKTNCVINIAGKTVLDELFDLFYYRCKFAVGSDSGPMHMASVVGLPFISLWGPTNPLRSAPIGNNEKLLITSSVDCAFCYKRVCPLPEKLCMKSISPEMVFEKIQHYI